MRRTTPRFSTSAVGREHSTRALPATLSTAYSLDEHLGLAFQIEVRVAARVDGDSVEEFLR